MTPRMYFVHIPKTGGVTLKTFLENNYAHGESLVIDEKDARALPAAALEPYRLLSGHYSSEVLEALDGPPDVTLLLVREPLARLRSWTAHGRRLDTPEHRARFRGRTDLEVVDDPASPGSFQAYWLARALRDGAGSFRIPAPSELPDLLDRIDLVGVTEHLERFMQLVSFRMGWPPPPLGWRINRRPDRDASQRPDIVGHEADDDELRTLLAVDAELHDEAGRRFWSAYAAMLTTIHPGRRTVSADQAPGVAIGGVQDWLRRHHAARARARTTSRVTTVDYQAGAPVAGEGWWWREVPGNLPYRWTGPTTSASLSFEPLAAGRNYTAEIELMGAADWSTWDGVRLAINGRDVDAVHERFGPCEPGDVTLRLHADITSDVVAAQQGETRVELRLPECRPVPGQPEVTESRNTVNLDRRLVGVAVHRVRIIAAASATN